MSKLLLATEALASGAVTRHRLRTRFVKVHRNVYAPAAAPLDARDRAEAAWLWSGRKATLAGLSAAAALGSRWVPADAPAELARVRQPAPAGIVVHTGRIAGDELRTASGMPCTTAARWRWSIPAPSRRRRAGCGCCSCGPGCRGLTRRYR